MHAKAAVSHADARVMTTPNTPPTGQDSACTLTTAQPRGDEGPAPFKLELADSTDAIRHVSNALDQTQRRLNNLKALIDRFDLDGDDGPRAA